MKKMFRDVPLTQEQVEAEKRRAERYARIYVQKHSRQMISRYFSDIGQLGGLTKSAKKAASSRANAARARRARHKKGKKGKTEKGHL